MQASISALIAQNKTPDEILAYLNMLKQLDKLIEPTQAYYCVPNANCKNMLYKIMHIIIHLFNLSKSSSFCIRILMTLVSSIGMLYNDPSR
jgi:hypothetical protein